MNVCLAPHCGRPTQNYLCNDCQNTLADMLSQLPFLIEELDTRIQRLDRITHGTIGRARSIDPPAIIDFDAAEAARQLRHDLTRWVERVAEQHTGRRPAILGSVATADLARWLQHNITAITRLALAGPLFTDIESKVGQDQHGGQLINAINPQPERHYAGPCPTIRAHNPRGEEVRCDTDLFADEHERTIECPACHHTIDVERNRDRAAKARDLHTKQDLLEVLANIGEPVTETQLDAWIKARRLRRSGWLHNGRLVKVHIRRDDPAVYSIARARKLRTRDNDLRSRKQDVTQ